MSSFADPTIGRSWYLSSAWQASQDWGARRALIRQVDEINLTAVASRLAATADDHVGGLVDLATRAAATRTQKALKAALADTTASPSSASASASNTVTL